MTTLSALQALYWIANPSEFADDTLFFTAIEQAIERRVGRIQYRDKSASNDQQLIYAKRMGQLTQNSCTQLIINDNLALAHQLMSEYQLTCGLHLGFKDTDASHAHQHQPRPICIGISCYNSLERAQNALAAGADYVSFGAFYPSTTKPEAKPAELTLLEQAKRQLQCPIVAIGGITADNAAPILEAGANWLAVAGALNRAPDFSAALSRFEECLQATV